MSHVRLALIGTVAVLVLLAISLPRMEAMNGHAVAVADSDSRIPVLVELFTSEGCSSCPPADALLERLDRSQPVSGAELIVLSEHVDYWNDIGWKDPFSSHEYSERQSAYAAQFGLGSIYTPQIVVDGHFELVGSDERRATQAIERATKVRKIPVSISLTDERMTTVHIETGPLPPAIPAESASVFLAIADNSDESHVSRGENAGRTLKHVAVLRDLVPVGTVGRTDKFSRDVAVNLNKGNRRDLRIMAIIQEPAAGRVWGVGLARLSN